MDVTGRYVGVLRYELPHTTYGYAKGFRVIYSIILDCILTMASKPLWQTIPSLHAQRQANSATVGPSALHNIATL